MKYKHQQAIDEFRSKFINDHNGEPRLLRGVWIWELEQFLDEQLSKKELETREETLELMKPNPNRDRKICRTCHLVKPIEDFFTKPSGKKYFECFDCRDKKFRDRYKEKKEHILEVNRKYNASEAGKEKNKRMYAKHRTKVLVRSALRYAIKKGEVVKKPCEVCGDVKAEAHHDDYSKPLDVKWFCKVHHAEYHVNQRKTQTKK